MLDRLFLILYTSILIVINSDGRNNGDKNDILFKQGDNVLHVHAPLLCRGRFVNVISIHIIQITTHYPE
jgi:hypothetical protein